MQKKLLFLTRVLLGWLYFYAGMTKVVDPSWTSAGYLKAAKVFSTVYQLMLSPEVLPVVDFMNKWGLTLLGVSLILGVGMRISVRLGVLLMALYYVPVMKPPFIDQHVIYSLTLVCLLVFGADKVWGVRGWLEKKKWVKKSLVGMVI